MKHSNRKRGIGWFLALALSVLTALPAPARAAAPLPPSREDPIDYTVPDTPGGSGSSDNTGGSGGGTTPVDPGPGTEVPEVNGAFFPQKVGGIGQHCVLKRADAAFFAVTMLQRDQ